MRIFLVSYIYSFFMFVYCFPFFLSDKRWGRNLLCRNWRCMGKHRQELKHQKSYTKGLRQLFSRQGKMHETWLMQQFPQSILAIFFCFSFSCFLWLVCAIFSVCQVKEDIFLNFQERVKDQNLTTCLIAKQVLLDTLNIVSSSFNGSQHTEKLESSEHLYLTSDKDNWSGSTIRVDSNGIEIGSGMLLHHFFLF